MNTNLRMRNILMILVGVAGLLAKRWLSGLVGELGHSYAGNVAVSFAVYFWVSLAAGGRLNRAITGALALIIVELFERTDGFGIMSNTYDPFDYLANAIGVGAAYIVDVLSSRVIAAEPAKG